MRSHTPLKRKLRELLDEGLLEQVADLAVRRKRVLGELVARTFDSSDLIGWRAVEAMGMAADRIAEHDPEYVRDHLRRLYWLLSEESGGLCWRAPEAMAEIVCRRPTLFADYVGVVAHLIVSRVEEDLERFRPGALWAIGRLGPLAADHLQDVLPAVASALDHDDPKVRCIAVWCLDQVGQSKLLADRPDLLADDGSVDLYEGRLLGRTTVRELVRRAL